MNDLHFQPYAELHGWLSGSIPASKPSKPSSTSSLCSPPIIPNNGRCAGCLAGSSAATFGIRRGAVADGDRRSRLAAAAAVAVGNRLHGGTGNAAWEFEPAGGVGSRGIAEFSRNRSLTRSLCALLNRWTFRSFCRCRRRGHSQDSRQASRFADEIGNTRHLEVASDRQSVKSGTTKQAALAIRRVQSKMTATSADGWRPLTPACARNRLSNRVAISLHNLR